MRSASWWQESNLHSRDRQISLSIAKRAFEAKDTGADMICALCITLYRGGKFELSTCMQRDVYVPRKYSNLARHLATMLKGSLLKLIQGSISCMDASIFL